MIVSNFLAMSKRSHLPNSLRWWEIGFHKPSGIQLDSTFPLDSTSMWSNNCGISLNKKILCQENLLQVDHELQNLQEITYLLFSPPKEKSLLYLSFFKSFYRFSTRIFATMVRKCLYSSGLYARCPVVCVPLNR